MLLKFMRFVAAAMFFLLVGFILLGLFCRSFSYTTTFHVNAPIDKTFGAFTDYDAMKDWMTGLENVQLISETENKIGNQYKFFISDPRTESVMTYTETITSIKPNQLYAFDIDNDWFTGNSTYQFTNVNSNSSVNVETIVKGKGLLKRSFLRLMKSNMLKQSEASHNAFKKYVELLP